MVFFLVFDLGKCNNIWYIHKYSCFFFLNYMLTECLPYVICMLAAPLPPAIPPPEPLLLGPPPISSLKSFVSRNTTVLITPLICSSGQMPSRIRCGLPRPFGRRSVPPSIDGPSMLWTRLAYSTNVGYGMSYFRAACDNDSPSLSTLNMASAMVSGRQDFRGPRSRKRR